MFAALLLAVACLLPLGSAEADARPAQEADEPRAAADEPAQEEGQEKESPANEEEAPPRIEIVEEGGAPVDIPPLPASELPKRTRVPPDPAREQLRRGKVYVEIDEAIEPKSGEEVRPEFLVVDEYVEEYFRRAGWEVIEDGAGAEYRVTGRARAVFDQELVFRGTVLGWKYYGAVQVSIVDRDGREVEAITIPDTTREGVKDEPTAARDLLRLLAKLVHDKIFFTSSIFGGRKAVSLIESLTIDPLEAEAPLAVEEVIERLADLGLEAVPVLLEALTDNRVVLAESRWPGLVDPAQLRVYHAADKALEEIFQKVSRMRLETTPDERFWIIRGWENEWRRFCPPFRDSPVYARFLATLRERRAAAEKAKREEERSESTSSAAAPAGDGASPPQSRPAPRPSPAPKD